MGEKRKGKTKGWIKNGKKTNKDLIKKEREE